MGRYYTTAKPTFVDDKMFQLPAELMYKALLKNEKDIDTQYEKIDAFNKTLKTDNLQTDDPAVNERLKEYRGKIDNYTQSILKKPLDYRKYQGEIATLSRDLETELDNGLLGKAQEQYTSFNDEMKRVGELKEVSSEKKDLLKRVIEKKYKEQGGLAYKDPNNYNKISDLYETPLNDVDTDKLINTIATNFEPDQTATATAGNTASGYIVTSSGTTRIRNAEDVGKYMETSLKQNGWEDQRRQYYQWKESLDEMPVNVDGSSKSVDQLIQEEKDALINQAKNKLGYSQETKDKGMSADSLYMQKLRMADENRKTKEGNIIIDQRDYRKEVDANGQRKYSDAQIKRFEGTPDAPGLRQKMTVLGQQIGVDDMDTFINEYVINGNISKIASNLNQLGMSEDDVREYINYQKANEAQKTPHYPGYEKLTEEEKINNPQLVIKQQQYLNGIVTAWNSMSPNDNLKSIKVWKDGVPTETNYRNIADLVESDKSFVYIPVTGTTKVPKVKTVGGYLVDSKGDIITDSKGNKLRTEQEAANAGKAGDVIFDTQDIASYDTKENLIQASTGNIKQNDNFEFLKDKDGDLKGEFNGRVDTSKEYVLTQNYFKVNKQTGKKELITVDLITDDSDIKIKQ